LFRVGVLLYINENDTDPCHDQFLCDVLLLKVREFNS